MSLFFSFLPCFSQPATQETIVQFYLLKELFVCAVPCPEFLLVGIAEALLHECLLSDFSLMLLVISLFHFFCGVILVKDVLHSLMLWNICLTM